jgi:putative two-component system response regulator
LAEARDDDTGKHLERVRTLCRILAENLKTDSLYSASILPDFVDTIKHAAPLHDIGKVAIPDNILLKPGKFTPDEIEIIQTHTITGAEYLQDVYNNYPNNVIIGMGIEIALYHHERWDGSGYPDGLVGSNIPLSARIMAVVDVYDALRSDRCYRKGFPHQKVIEMILEESGTHFDPEVCKSFVAAEEKFEAVFNELLG